MDPATPETIYAGPDDAAALRERLLRLEARLAEVQPAGPPAGFAPPMPAPLVLLSAASAPVRRHWLDWALVRELRFVAFMYLDPRYRLSRLGQFGIPGVLLAAVLNYLAFNYLLVTIPFVTQVGERLVLVGLGAVLYLLLIREGARYRTVLEYLAEHHR